MVGFFIVIQNLVKLFADFLCIIIIRVFFLIFSGRECMLTSIKNEIKKTGILVSFVILVALVGCGKATNHVEVGQTLLEQGKVEDAAIEFKKAIERDPNSPEAHFGLGNTYAKKQELEDAAIHYRKAIKLDAKFVEAYKRLSETFIEMGAPDSYFEKKYNAIEDNPDDPIARIDLGVLYHGWDQTRNAIMEYEEALTLDPDNPFIYYNLAVAYQDMNLFEDKAIPLYMKTIELQPGYDNAHYNLAVSYLKTNRLEDAMVEYKKTLEINPNYAPVYVDYGMIQLREKNFDDAMKHYGKALEIDPNNIEAYYQKGIVYAFQENWDEALKMNRKALEIDPKHINSQFNIAVVYHKRGELKRAIAEYDLTLEIDRNYQDAYYNRGQIYASMGNRPQAYGDYIAYSKIMKAKTGKEGAALALRGIEDKEQIQRYLIPSFKDWILEQDSR